MIRRLALFASLLVLGCGAPSALKNPFSGLQAGVCLDNSDCEIGRCPNACNFGQTFCSYPAVYAHKDVLRKCPCVETPSSASCAAPSADACGPQPGCAGPADADKVLARCILGMCAARFTDGGGVP